MPDASVTAAMVKVDELATIAIDSMTHDAFMRLYVELTRVPGTPRSLSPRNTRTLRSLILGIPASHYTEVLKGRAGSAAYILGYLNHWKTWTDKVPDLPALDYRQIELILRGDS